MYINFQQNRANSSVITVHTNVCKKNRKLHEFTTTNKILKNRLFQPNRDSKSVKTVHTSLFAKICKLHKFATCNKNFEKSRLSDMNYPLTDILAHFEINRPVRCRNTAKRNYFHRRTDRRRARQQ